MKAMILAAGEGTRLRPLTANVPKPMVPVAGRPALEYTVEWLRHYGIREIVMNLHHCPEAVIRHFGDGRAFGVSIDYSVEERILGTAGGTKRQASVFDGPFVVVYGDVLTDLDLSALAEYHSTRASALHLTMSLYRVPDPERCGVAVLDVEGRVTRFVEKPRRGQCPSDLASAGVLILDPEILRNVPDGVFYDYGQDLFPALLQDGIPIYGWPLPNDAYLIDFGTPENYQRAQTEWPTARSQRFMTQAGQ
jgi:NDP-sugar pyrophosphorylase family protein